MTQEAKQQSSPFSSGSGGANFETRVQAAIAALMLAGGKAPCLPPWPISRIKLQGRYAGYKTDDLIIFVRNSETAQEAKLLAQVKHSVSITEGDAIFSEVIRAAWNDRKDPQVFSLGVDSFALFTGPLSASDIHDVRPLLEWARHCETSEEFITKVNTPGFGSDPKRRKLNAFRSQLGKANDNTDISDDELWQFLKSFHLIGYDLDAESAGTLSLLQSLISLSSPANASETWSRVVDAVQSANQDAGTLTLETIPRDVVSRFSSTPNPHWVADFGKLQDHGNYILKDIRTDIGGVTIRRTDLLTRLVDACETAEFIFVTGPRGCGKSGLVREFVNHLAGGTPVFCVRTEDLDQPHLDNVFSRIGLMGSLSEIEAGCALIPRKYLLIESLEKLLELENASAFTDLLHFLQKHKGWVLIATGRDYAFQQILFNYVQPAGISCSSLDVTNFSDGDLQHLCSEVEVLRSFATNPNLTNLMTNPFLANLAYRVAMTGATVPSDGGEQAFRNAVWEHVIAKEQVRSGGMPLRRRRTFIDVAVKRAKQMVYGISERGFDSEVLLDLEADNLLSRDRVLGLVSPAHDVLDDWAIAAFIEETFRSSQGDVHAFLFALGPEPAINRAFRLWLHEKIRFGHDMASLVVNLLRDQAVSKNWQDEVLAAVLLGDNPHDFVSALTDDLFANGGDLLKRLCFVLRISCKVPDMDVAERGDAGSNLFLKPHGRGWDATIRFLYQNMDRIEPEFVVHVAAVLDEWATLIPIDGDLPNPSREAALLAMHLLESVGRTYQFSEYRRKLLSVIIKVSSAVTVEFRDLLARTALHRNSDGRPRYADELISMALTGIETAFLCRNMPDDVISLARQQWLASDASCGRFPRSARLDVDECFAIHEHRAGSNFFPASGMKGPFSYLLRFQAGKGVDFILDLCNRAAAEYVASGLDDRGRYPTRLSGSSDPLPKPQVELRLADGCVVKQCCTERLWFAYRGASLIPYVLQSGLMALENWLIGLAEQSESPDVLEKIYDYILRNSNSVMTTAVLASVATGFPSRLGRSALPLLRTPQFYDHDMKRSLQERSVGAVDWHSPMLGRDIFAGIYAEERRKAASRPWRKEHIETLLIRLQLSALRDESLAVIDELHTRVPADDTIWRFRFNRIDSRRWQVQADEENNRFLLTPSEVEADLHDIQRRTEEQQELNERFSSLWLWAANEVNNEPHKRRYYESWTHALAEAKELLSLLKTGRAGELAEMYGGGIVKAASVFLRDNSANLSQDDAAWCAGLIVGALVADANGRDPIAAADETDNSGAAASASVLPVILDYASSDEKKLYVQRIIVVALTHANDDVRSKAAIGIRKYLWQREADFARKCMFGSLEYARLQMSATDHGTETDGLLTEHREDSARAEDGGSWIDNLRERWIKEEIVTNPADISFGSHSSWHLLAPCLMVPNGSVEGRHIELMSRMFSLLAGAKSKDSGDAYDEESLQIDDELPIGFMKRFAEYLSTIPSSHIGRFVNQLQDACETAPQLVWWFMLYMAVAAERAGDDSSYWQFWKLLSGKVQDIALTLAESSPEEAQSDGRTRLIRGMLYADAPWQQADYEKCTIAHGKDSILNFVEKAGRNADVFEAMASLMYHFPAVFFNQGLALLAQQQEALGGTRLLSGVNTTFYLEMSLQRYLLRESPSPMPREVHRRCRVLLDAIIETTSSRAYFLREYLMRSKRVLN